MTSTISTWKPMQRFYGLLALDRKDISYIYLYAVFGGLITLSLPLGIQAIIGLIAGGAMSNSLYLLIGVVTFGTALTGFLKIMQLVVAETLQRRIFVRSAFEFSVRLPQLRLERIQNEYPPELVNRFFDTLTIQKGIPKLLMDFSTALLNILFGLVLIAFYHPFFAFFGIFLLVCVGLIFRLTGPGGLTTSLKESKYKYAVAHWLTVRDRCDENSYSSFGKLDLPSAHRMFIFWLSGLFFLMFIFLFLPWTQNIQSKGKITTLSPGQRPQNIEATIAGRIEKWYVREGQFVNKGDTIAYLSEIKVEYFDDNLVNRTQMQVKAKSESISAYQQKAIALDQQVIALRQELILKKEQLSNKINQSNLIIQSAKADFQQAQNDFKIAEYQYNRTDTLYQKGIKSLTDLEGKRLKVQSTQAKLIGAENKLLEAENEKFRFGESSIFLVNSREQKVMDANLKLVKYITSYHKNRLGLIWSTGLLQ